MNPKERFAREESKMEIHFERPKFVATNMGNVPYKEVKRAVETVVEYFPVAPSLPVTTRSIRWMLEGIPCLVFDRQRRQILMDPSPEREPEILEFYDRYEQEDLDYFATTPDTAPFLYALLDRLKEVRPNDLRWVRFQTAGPLILGDTIKQMDGNPALYHETLRDILVKGSNIKARWLEKKIKEEIPGVEVIADLPETTLVNFTSAGGTGTREDMVSIINESFRGLNCLKWIHCCANIDWSILTDTETDVINFDAYHHAERVSLYHQEIKGFLERGGMIGWGIIPVNEELFSNETVDRLTERLQSGIELFVKKGIDETLLVSGSWVLPCCDTSLLRPENSDQAFVMAREISNRMKVRYGFA
jgi:hypothetical protein